MLAASWTAWMFGKHPETSVSIIEVQAYVIPTMGEYRAGGQPRWLVVGAYSFARR
ncbi:MAG TPA: hypothetical protein VF611_17210 [Pyrinomonadaceae bacterium]